MIAQTSQLTISPTILLWIVFALAAALLLFSALHRRRTVLTDALKAFVGSRDDSAQTDASPSIGLSENQDLAEKNETIDR